MSISRFNLLLRALSSRERVLATVAMLVCIVAVGTRATLAVSSHSVWAPVAAGSYREGIVGQPISLNPIISANPADQDLSALIYSRLAQLATTIEGDQELRMFTVKLAEGLTWDDGTPLTSDDVIFTVKTIQNPDAQSPLATGWRGVVAERGSELQIKFTLPSSYAFFGETLKRLPVIPRHIFGTIPLSNLRLSSFNLTPVGSGPFRADGYDMRSDGFITEYRLVPNRHYYGTAPFIQNFSFRFYPDAASLSDAFRARTVDGFGLALPPSADTALPASAVVEQIPMPRSYAIFMNQSLAPILQNDNFREALGEAVDRNRLIKEVFGKRGTPIESLHFTQEGASTATYLPDAAREHLAAAKVEQKGLALSVPQIPALQKVAELVKNDWNAVGIAPISIETAPPDEFVESVVQGRNYQLLLFGNTLENPDDLYPFWHSAERFAPGFNFSSYQRAEVDQLLEQNRKTDDPEKRARNLERIVALIAKDNPAVFLFSLPYLYVHRDVLQGFGSNGTFITSADRFGNVAAWNVTRVRVIR